MSYKKNDLVQVIAGKEKGKTGKILRLLPKKSGVVIEKLNMFKKHSKRDKSIVEKEASIHVSNILLYCDSCKKPVRHGMKLLKDGKKVRFCKKCNEVLDK